MRASACSFYKLARSPASGNPPVPIVLKAIFLDGKNIEHPGCISTVPNEYKFLPL